METVVLSPGETRRIEGHPAEVKVASDAADERFCVLEATIGTHPGPQLHRHRRHIETFYVLDGALEITSGTELVPAPADSFVLVPRTSPHTFRNPGPDEAHILGFHAPGGLDRFLAGLGQILGSPGEPDYQALAELLARHDTEPADPEEPADPPVRVLGQDEGERLSFAGATITIKADSGDADGLFALFEYVAPPEFPGPPPHRHREVAEIFYVLEGEPSIHVDGEELASPAGSFVLVAPGTVHRFSNPSDRPTRFLCFLSPGGLEEYFRRLAQALGEGPVDPAVLGQLLADYDYEPA